MSEQQDQTTKKRTHPIVRLKNLSILVFFVSLLGFVSVWYIQLFKLPFLGNLNLNNSLYFIGLSLLLSFICIGFCTVIYLSSNLFYETFNDKDKDKDEDQDKDKNKDVAKDKKENKKVPFPSQATRYAGQLLLWSAGLSVVLLFIVITSPHWCITGANDTNCDPNNKQLEFLRNFSQMQHPIIMMLAACVGSSIATFLGYLKHACEKEDFELRYLPWYLLRPIMGMLLGLIFYFLIKGSLLTLLVNDKTISKENIDIWGLAGVGALVGLFSKQAIEKLNEIFSVMFQTQDDTSPDVTPPPDATTPPPDATTPPPTATTPSPGATTPPPAVTTSPPDRN